MRRNIWKKRCEIDDSRLWQYSEWRRFNDIIPPTASYFEYHARMRASTVSAYLFWFNFTLKFGIVSVVYEHLYRDIKFVLSSWYLVFLQRINTNLYIYIIILRDIWDVFTTYLVQGDCFYQLCRLSQGCVESLLLVFLLLNLTFSFESKIFQRY